MAVVDVTAPRLNHCAARVPPMCFFPVVIFSFVAVFLSGAIPPGEFRRNHRECEVSVNKFVYATIRISQQNSWSGR